MGSLQTQPLPKHGTGLRIRDMSVELSSYHASTMPGQTGLGTAQVQLSEQQVTCH